MTPQPKNPLVLIVDDNQANRLAFTTLLEGTYTVTTASSGREAITLASMEEYTVILLDVRMPLMDGFETAEILRKVELARHTPIIFTSAFDHNIAQVKKGYVAGATDFILSPVDEELLKFKVAAFTRLFLRNETLRLQIDHLNSLVRDLQTELLRRPAEEEMKSRFQDLEDVVEELQRHVLAWP